MFPNLIKASSKYMLFIVYGCNEYQQMNLFVISYVMIYALTLK
jgi:hypothetical protein